MIPVGRERGGFIGTRAAVSTLCLSLQASTQSQAPPGSLSHPEFLESQKQGLTMVGLCVSQAVPRCVVSKTVYLSWNKEINKEKERYEIQEAEDAT